MSDEASPEGGADTPEGTGTGRVPAKEGAARRVFGWLIRGAALLLIVIAVALAVLNSPIGHRFVVDQIQRLEPENGLRIKIGRIEGSLYGQLYIRDLTLSDPKGAFLRVPRTSLDWRPFNWFVRGLDIRQLVARRGTLLRLPELIETDPDAPLLPEFDIHIGRLRLIDFTVAEGVAGDARRVQLDARARKTNDGAYLKIESELGGTDRLSALLDSDISADRFDANLDYRAPAGGLLAGLTGATKDMRARIVGDGKRSDWKGALLVEQGGQRMVALRLTNRSGRYGILGQAYPAQFTSGEPARLLGRAVAIGASATLDRSVLDGVFRAEAASLGFKAAGAVDLSANTFDDLALTARTKGLVTLADGVSLRGGTLDATLNGPFRDLAIEHRLAVAELDAGTKLAGFVQKGTIRRQDDVWTLPLDLAVASVQTGVATIDPRLVRGRGTGRLVLDGNKLAGDNLRLDFPGLAARFSLNGDTARGDYALAGPVAARGFALENLGIVNADAKILFRMAGDAPWTLRADLAGRMPRVTNDTLTAIVGTGIRFQGGIAMGGGRPLMVEKASLNASKLALFLDGRVTDDRTTLVGRGRHADYGPFTVDAAIAGDGPRAELVFAEPYPAAGLVNVRVALAPIPDGFQIETAGGSLLGPFDGLVNLFMRPRGPTQLAIERMTISQTDLSGDLTLGDGGVNGTLTLAGGGLDGTIALAPRDGGQGIVVALNARDARFGGENPLRIGTAKIDASGVIGGGRTQIAGSIDAQGIGKGQLFIGRLTANADVVNGRGHVNAAITGRRGSRFRLQLQSAFEPERITLVARGNYAGQQISMPRRAVLTREDGGWVLAPTQISYSEGIVIGQGRFGGGPTELKVHLSGMPLSLIDVVAENAGLGGRISGIVEYRAEPDGLPTGTAQVEVRGLTRSGLVLTSRPVDAFLVAELSASQFETRAVIREEGAQRGRLQGRIVNLPRLGSVAERLRAGALFAQLRYDGPADAIWRLAAIEAFDLTGPLSIAADVTGTLDQPIARGSLASDALRLQSSLTGTDIRQISARGSFSGSRLRLTRFAGRDEDGGTVSGSGMVDLSGLGPRGPVIDLRIAARNAQLLDRRDMAAKVTGPIRIVSDGMGGTIAGRLRIHEANWRLGNAAGGRALPDIATREINLPADIAPRAARSRPWRYLIDANGSSRLFVRGMGLDSEWSARIALRGTTSDPRIGGNAEVVRGSYEFAGTRFDLTRGRIAFDQSGPVDPRLDILAETDVDSLNVRVAVKGSATQPEITFSSVPSLPEEEILARLLFGGSISDLGATDALQLGAALASLRGGGGMDPINQLRSAIGLDRLRIVNADPALGVGTAVAAGKNIGRRFYAEIITDGKGYSATNLEFRVTRWLSLLGSVSTIGRESIVAKASKDY